MSVLKRKEPGQYGDTHYVVENDYRKNQDGEESGDAGAPSEPSNEVPF